MALLHLVGLGWGLPSSDGWDNDGVAPRDFLAGLVATFTPGQYFTYPPVHLVLLGILTAPITVVALARASSLAPPDVLQEILKVPYMTAVSYIARLTTVAMSVGLVWTLAKIGEEIRGADGTEGTAAADRGPQRRVGQAVAAMCGVNASFTYYAHTTNLDVPYLFWACLGLLALTRAIARHEPRRLRRVAVMAALAVGSKDQAYGLFLLTLPAALVVWVALDAWAQRNVRTIAKELAWAVAIGIGLLVVVDAIVVNPSGFRARLQFLVGSASQDYAHYSRDALGRALVVLDSVLFFPRYYPLVFAPFVVVGVALVVRPRGGANDRALRVAGLVPLLAAVSFTLLFNCAARRTEHRFLLPQMVLWSVYGGIALGPFVFGFRPGARRLLAQGLASVAFALAIFTSAAVDANLVLDPRYDAEDWLSRHVTPGDVVEVYGNNVYMPRLPPQAHGVRVGHEAIDKRNPLPGIEEVQDRFGNAQTRGPRFIVVSEGWAWRYLFDPRGWGQEGYIVPPTQMETANDKDATSFFQSLLRGERGYERVHSSTWQSKLWPRMDIHASVAREIWIFERR